MFSRVAVTERVRENLAIAVDTLRVSKLRSALTILGVVIGVSTVMAMATIVQGIRNQIVNTIEIAGPTTFYVIKYFSQTPLNPDRLPKEVRIRPELSTAEALRIRELPEVKYAGLWAQTFGRVEYKGQRTQQLAIFGADDHYADFQGGELLSGRWFTPAELKGDNVAVLEEGAADKVFGQEDPLGKTVRVQGRPMRVIGVYSKPGNIFEPPGTGTGAIVPYETADHEYKIDKTNALWIIVKPRDGVTVPDAQNAVTVALREMRKLHPGDPNTFDLITQDQILDIWNKITGVFSLVMIVLSAVALLVGGIGVMAMMMVSVTSRTKEIGLRKAMGATRRDIMLQFLVEAATLTGIGGAIGILIGLLMGKLGTWLMNVDASAPIALTIIAVIVSILIGVLFGVLPAVRAAKLDPVEALRYE